jgi:DNA-binding beta-propeller fold protein YncE
MGNTSTLARLCLGLGWLLSACGRPAAPAELPPEASSVPSPTSTQVTTALTDTPVPLTDAAVPLTLAPSVARPTGTPTPRPTPTEPGITQVAIDGQPEDWARYPTLLTDGEADTFQGGFDLKSVRAFTNDRYLYLILDAYGEIGDYVQVDLDIDADGDGKQDTMATFRPRTGRRDLGDFTSGEEVWGPMRGGSAAEGGVVEFKMPLGLLAGREAFTLLNIRVMNGECCGQAWYVVDDMGPVSVPRAYEREPTQGERLQQWSSRPLTGMTSTPFVIHEGGDCGTRGVALNQAAMKAYLVGEFSGELSWVDIDPTSPGFGAETVIADDLFILNDVAVNRAETLAYVTREAGPGNPPRGRNAVMRVDLRTGQVATVTDQVGQPTNIVLSQDETEGYVVDFQQGKLYRVDLKPGAALSLAGGLDEPFAVAVNQAETLAYVATMPARAGDYPRGDLLSIDLQTGQVSTLAPQAIHGASGIILSTDEKLAFVTEFGPEAECGGQLSVINIDPASADLGSKIVLITGLCGVHDVKLDQAETLLYYVEVGASRFSVIRVDLSAIRWR